MKYSLVVVLMTLAVSVVQSAELSTHVPAFRAVKQPSFVHDVSFSSDGSLLACAGGDGRVVVLNAASGSTVLSFQASQSHVYAVRYSPDDRMIATAGLDSTVRLFNAADGGEIAVLRGHEGHVHSLAFSRDGATIASGGSDGTIRLWSVSSFKQQVVLTGHSYSVTALSFTPAGKSLLSGATDGSARIWDVNTGSLTSVLPFEPTSGYVYAVAFEPQSGNPVTTFGGNGNYITQWDKVTRKPANILEGHTASVTSVAISSDGSCMVTGSADESVRLWDYASGALLTTLDGHQGYVTSVAVSHDGRFIASGDIEGNVIVWTVDIGDDSFTMRFPLQATPVRPATVSVHPNPSAGIVTIAFSLGGESFTEVAITDMAGRRIATPVTRERYGAGTHEIPFDAGLLGNGVYHAIVTTPHGSLSAGFTILR